MQFVLPSADTILEIHEIVINQYGGLHGVPHPDRIEAALQRPRTYMDYQNEYGIHVVAALILDSFARNHAFADGNKRTALLAMLMTYNLNNITKIRYDLHMNKAFEELVLEVTTKKPTIKVLQAKLRQLIEEYSVN